MSRSSWLGSTAESLCQEFLAMFRELYPGRKFFLTLSESLPLVTREMPQTRLQLSREGYLRSNLSPDELARHEIEVVDEYETRSPNATLGFDLPLRVGQKVYGVLGIEYMHGAMPPPGEDTDIAALLSPLASALRDQLLHQGSLGRLDHYTRLLESANTPIMIIGRRRDITFANRAMGTLTGLPKSDLVGRDLMDLLPDSERGRLQPVVLNALRGHSTAGFEINVTHANGEVARLSFNVGAVIGPAGKPDGVIAIGHDISQVRALEEQVAQAEKLATLGQLAAGVVHELNNPLTSISVYSEHLLKKLGDRDLEAKDLEKLRRIRNSVDRILRFTKDLVTYARPSTERPEQIRADEVIEQGLVFCEHVIEDTGVTVSRDYASDAPSIFGVRSQLHQVLINLITNACHAMPEGAGHLSIQTSLERPEALTIRLTDNGAGVPPDLQKRIFEPFFTTKEGGKGTGLGLSIVRKLIAQHGGNIALKSELGAGTTFVITLPTSA